MASKLCNQRLDKSQSMARVKSKGSVIEKTLQRELWNRGLRYIKNDSKITGKPDICFRGAKIAVFCDSEFWHGFDWEHRKEDFRTNKEFWISKIERNMERDKEVNIALESEGWMVLRYWGNDIKKDTVAIADEIEKKYRERKKK